MAKEKTPYESPYIVVHLSLQELRINGFMGLQTHTFLHQKRGKGTRI